MTYTNKMFVTICFGYNSNLEKRSVTLSSLMFHDEHSSLMQYPTSEKNTDAAAVTYRD